MPDLLLQETNQAWEAALRGALSHVYRHMAFLDPDRRAVKIPARDDLSPVEHQGVVGGGVELDAAKR